jgi:hypothetical protein
LTLAFNVRATDDISSTVHRDGRDVTGPSAELKIEFTDSRIEQSETVRAFLSLIAHGEVLRPYGRMDQEDIPAATLFQSWTSLLTLAEFLLKYNCAAHIRAS